LIERAETRRKRADSLVTIHLQVENVNDEGVSRFRAFNKKWPREWIVAFDQRKRIPRLLDGIPEAVQ